MRALLLTALLLPASAAAAPPNIVMLIGDDMGYADYSFLGHPHVRTPHLDKLAADGLVFRRGYVPSSLCRASLATMVTGLYPHQHKITSNDPPLPPGKTGRAAQEDPAYQANKRAMIAFLDKVPTLPRLLAEAGYVSHQSGKWWEGNACRCGGFTEGMTTGDPAKNARHGDEGLTIGRQGLKPVLDFIDRSAGEKKPFYLWYAPMMPHAPHNPPERLLAKYKDRTPSLHVARYWAMCEWFDETCGELLGHLDKKGLTNDTLVVYLCDNGWIQDPNSGNYAPRSKRSPYDGGLRTPIVLRWPGRIAPGVSDDLAQSLDVAPTVLAAVGLKATKEMPGLDLRDAAARRARKTLFGEVFEHNAVDVHSPAANLQYRWVVDGNWKLIVPSPARVPKGKPELYDVGADPEEKSERGEKNPAKVEELTKRLDAWWPGR